MEQYSGYWENEMKRTPSSESVFSAEEYHRILCPDVPDFLYRYMNLGILLRLDGIGLLCGSDWTPLFNNRFFYSRLDHSIGTALIVWNFTQSKRETIAALLHDVSTPSFSHAVDFKNGDALTQQSTENINRILINQDEELNFVLKTDGLYQYEVNDYHKYPVADNDMPHLSADRLEYMYPSGGALNALWSLDEIKENYSHIKVCINEDGVKELGFDSEKAAATYAKKFADISLLLQHNEDKVCLQLMAECLTRAIEYGFIEENDLYLMSEKEMIDLFDEKCRKEVDQKFTRLYYTYRHMTKVIHSKEPMENAFNLNLKVKKRYVNPLVVDVNGNIRGRIGQLDESTARCIREFLDFEDEPYGCVPWLK